MNGARGLNLMHAPHQSHHYQQKQQCQWHLQQMLFSDDQVATAAAVAALQQMQQHVGNPLPAIIAADFPGSNFVFDHAPEIQEAGLLIRIVAEVGENVPKSSLWKEVARKVSAQGIMWDAGTCKEKFNSITRYHEKENRWNGRVAKVLRDDSPDNRNANNSLALVTTDPSSSESAAGGHTEAQDAPLRQKNSWKAVKMHLKNIMKASLDAQEAWQLEFLKKIDREMQQQADDHEQLVKLQESQERIEAEELRRRKKFDGRLMAWFRGILTAVDDQNVDSLPSPSAFFQDAGEDVGGDDGEDLVGAASVGKRLFWSDREIKELLELRAEMDRSFFEAGDGKNTNICWEELSDQMSKAGFIRSSKSCREKWENVNRSYMKQCASETFPHSMLRKFYELGLIRCGVDGNGDDGDGNVGGEPVLVLNSMMNGSAQKCVKNYESNHDYDDDGNGNGRKRSWAESFESLGGEDDGGTTHRRSKRLQEQHRSRFCI